MANKGNPKWQKGQSGNPNGRPKKERALTAMLDKGGNRLILVDGKEVPAKDVLVKLIWDAVTTGRYTYVDGVTVSLAAEDWIATVKFLFGQLDGPPPRPVELSGPNGEPIAVKGYVTISPDDWDEQSS